MKLSKRLAKGFKPAAARVMGRKTLEPLMPSPLPTLFDTGLLAQRRSRAAHGFAQADFLHREIAAEIQERLEEVNKSFQSRAIIGWQAGLWGEIMGGTGLAVPDADVLGVETGAHDLVIHALGLHWANDPVGQLVQCRRALRPDGLMIAALFGGQTLHELRVALAEAEIELSGGLSPRIAPMGELRDLGALLQRAGFALPVADLRRFDVTYKTPMHLMAELRAMGETNVMAARSRKPMRRALLARACEIYAQHFPAKGGGVRATFEVAFLTGWAPHDSQQKPLRPGSAAASLADALGTVEQSAGEKPGK